MKHQALFFPKNKSKKKMKKKINKVSSAAILLGLLRVNVIIYVETFICSPNTLGTKLNRDIRRYNRTIKRLSINPVLTGAEQ